MTTPNTENNAGLIEQIVGVLTEKKAACPDREGREHAALVCAIENLRRAIRAQDPAARDEYILRAMHYAEEVWF